jgi:tRNA-specific 2-thiouridylase
MSKSVLVAMSGGVDSSVTAALLIKQGFAVEGVTMKLTSGLCCDIGSAQAVCAHLSIPHRVIDAQAAFSHSIVADFIAEYRRGRTPNPCIRCNDLIKFRHLLEYAKSNGFDHLATGHYARIEYDSARTRFVLKRGLDAEKDQSYFLYRLTQSQMKTVIFPLGGMCKTEVRSLAREHALPAAERPESQEICFVPDNDYRAFLKEQAPEALKPGEMVLTDGTVVGKHDGVAFFTVGQRRHLGIAAGERLYVVRIESGRNRVVLGTPTELEVREAMVSDVNVFDGSELRAQRTGMVKIRYRSAPVLAKIELVAAGRARVVFDQPVKGVCPGQAAVFYDNDEVVGGGIIET